MWKYLELRSIPSMCDEGIPHKLAWGKKTVHTFAVGTQPFVDVGLGGERNPRGHPRIALGLHHMPEAATLASFTSLSLRYKVVARAEELEIVQVINHGNTLGSQFPQDRR